MVTSCHPEQPASQRHMQKARKEIEVRTEKRGDIRALEPSLPPVEGPSLPALHTSISQVPLYQQVGLDARVASWGS